MTSVAGHTFAPGLIEAQRESFAKIAAQGQIIGGKAMAARADEPDRPIAVGFMQKDLVFDKGNFRSRPEDYSKVEIEIALTLPFEYRIDELLRESDVGEYFIWYPAVEYVNPPKESCEFLNAVKENGFFASSRVANLANVRLADAKLQFYGDGEPIGTDKGDITSLKEKSPFYIAQEMLKIFAEMPNFDPTLPAGFTLLTGAILPPIDKSELKDVKNLELVCFGSSGKPELRETVEL